MNSFHQLVSLKSRDRNYRVIFLSIEEDPTPGRTQKSYTYTVVCFGRHISILPPNVSTQYQFVVNFYINTIDSKRTKSMGVIGVTEIGVAS